MQLVLQLALATFSTRRSLPTLGQLGVIITVRFQYISLAIINLATQSLLFPFPIESLFHFTSL